MIITACAPYVYTTRPPLLSGPEMPLGWSYTVKEGGNARGVLMHTELQKYSLIQCVLEYNQMSLAQIP